eukprot:TRINITY_DN4111_c0_g2_i1.p1 TRINITY_DN4111_c0_g2~~TRINITY_DN4111_c0_g2_i1.p1  ORF type:complete len:513 (-),score=87.74 TRINITY_DN4111_c0_g2_i1:221-1633(-)
MTTAPRITRTESSRSMNGADSRSEVVSISSRAKISNQRSSVKMKFVLSLKEIREGNTLIVDHVLFETVIAVAITANCIILGIEVDSDLGLAGVIIQICFAALWFVEVGLKICCYGPSKYFWNTWDLLDFVVAVITAVDAFVLPFVLESGNSSSTARAIRIIRIIRVVRLLKLIREVWLLCLGLVKAAIALSSVLLLAILVVYVFGILFTYLVGKGCHDAEDVFEGCDEMYGTLPKSMYSLFEVMTLEMSSVRPMVAKNPWMQIPVLMFVVCSSFGLLNVIMGVIVEQVLEASRCNAEILAQQKEERQRLEMESLRDIFAQADRDKSGTVSQREFLGVCKGKDVQGIFADIDLPVSRNRLAERVFDVLDGESQGELSIDDFVDRVMTLKQEGRRLKDDQTLLLMDVRALNRRMVRLESRMDKLQDGPSLQDVMYSIACLRSEIAAIPRTAAENADACFGEDIFATSDTKSL